MKLLSSAVAAGIFCACFLMVAPASAAKAKGVCVFSAGDVQVQRAGKGDFAKLEVNDLLYAKDVVRTGPDGRASIITSKGAEVRVNSSSELKMPSGSWFSYYFYLARGQVWSRMLHMKAKLSVRTPAAICAIRGTEADIEQRSLLTVKVYEGHVDVKNGEGKQSLFAGQITTVAGGSSAPAAPRAMSEGEMGDWQSGVKAESLGKYLDRMGLGRKNLRVKINKDGQEVDVDVRLKSR